MSCQSAYTLASTRAGVGISELLTDLVEFLQWTAQKLLLPTLYFTTNIF
jgi:hypothetical protein